MEENAIFLWAVLYCGSAKTRDNIVSGMDVFFMVSKIDEEFL